MGIKAVVMAGGKGTRLRPITYSIPKPLVPIAGKPCINYILDSFYNIDVRNVIVTTGYKYDSLINGIMKAKHQDQNILFSVELEAAGTAGSVKLVSRFLDDTFLVGSGDILMDFRLKKMLDFHKKNGAKVTVALTTVEDPSQFGIVELRDDKIMRFQEKPKAGEAFSNLVNAGLYIIEPEIMDLVPRGVPYDFAKDLFPKLLSSGVDIYGYRGEGTWLDTGRPNDMIRANQLMTEKYGLEFNNPNLSGHLIMNTIYGKLSASSIVGPSYIGYGVTLGNNCRVSGSAIYDGVEVGDDVIIENSILMDGVKVMGSSKVINSVVMNGTSLGKMCEIHDSVLAPRMNLQENSRVYNLALSPETPED
ncbi:MAG: NDP-sugar synthase [Thermoplasmatales archaeon]|nr:NDP-sugar synthase [Thermoplasmatales archaeon]MCW6171110.1 NDP-sugar synthase [Thermoplasmatales archaeon]